VTVSQPTGVDVLAGVDPVAPPLSRVIVPLEVANSVASGGVKHCRIFARPDDREAGRKNRLRRALVESARSDMQHTIGPAVVGDLIVVSGDRVGQRLKLKRRIAALGSDVRRPKSPMMRPIADQLDELVTAWAPVSNVLACGLTMKGVD
jgi:hypothetical protein